MVDVHWSVASAAVVVAIGGYGVCYAYVDVFGNEEASDSSSHHQSVDAQNDGDGYTNSRFWLGIQHDTALVLWPLQISAATGFVVFILYLFIDAHRRRGPIASKGILSYLNGGATVLVFSMFFVCSYCWPYATRAYLNGGGINTHDMLRASVSLTGAAICAILMVAGAFEADMHPIAVLGILAFSNVVVLADGIGWNAKLIHSHYHESGNGTTIAYTPSAPLVL